MSRFLRFCAFLSVVFFTSNLMAAGYTCSLNPTYISCEAGYYLSDCDANTSWKGQTISPKSGNSCNLCPAGYECAGGNVCPNSSAISCDAGTYIKANTTTCTACPAGSYCPGITGSGGSTASDRGITKCPSGYQDGTDTGSKLESDCVMKVEAGKYVKTAKGSSASTCASGTYKGAHTVNYGQTSTCVSCPNNYPGSVAGAESIVSCYATCQPGTAVFTVQQPCKTQAGAWYTSEEHNVYYGSISNVSYCPIDSASELQGTTSASHDSQDDCKVEVKAGYGSTVTTAVAQYIRISSTTGVFPLAEIRVSNATDGPLTLAPGSGMTNAAGALDSNLSTQAVVNVLSGSMYYAIFDLNEQRSIDTIAFALGSSGTVGFEIKIEMSNDKTLWTTVFDSTVFGVSKLPGVFQYVNVNSRTYDECSGGTYNEATVVVASEPVECTACPKAACTGAADCASGYTTHMTEYPANFHSGENLKLVQAWFPESANKGNTSIEECKLSYSFTNNRGSFSQDALRYNSTTGRYDGAGGGVVYYTALKSGYYGSGKLTDTYCDTNPDVRRQMYQDAVLCPAGSYCVGYSQMPLCSSGTYNDTIGITGKVDAGYYSTGGGTSRTPIASGDGCLSSEECGSIAPGYWGVAGETKSTGSGAVSAGYYSTYGGTSATPSGFQNGCVGYDGNSNPTCGPVAAGYYSTGGGTAANGKCLSGYNCGMTTPGYYSTGGAVTNVPSADDCVGANDCGTIAAGYWGVQGAETSMGSGTVNAGYYSTGGATTPAPTEGACVGANDCGIVGAGYYSTGGGTSANGTCLDAYDCGQVDAGYYNLGGGTSATPEVRGKGCVNVSTTQCGTVAPGYWGAAGATQYGGSGAVRPGYYSTGGATSATPTASDCAGKVAIIENGMLMGASEVDNTCGQVQAGYWNNACGINATGGVCSTSYQGGIIAAGYWGTTGATDSVGSGRLAPGYYSTGGATVEYPDPNQCVGNNTCGAIDAGYWNNGGGTLAAPIAPGNGCHSDKSCGTVNAGYYSTGGGTSATPTAADNGCLANKSCGQVNAGYYSTGGGTSAAPVAAGNGCLNGKQCGVVDAGYYATGGATSAQGHGIIKLGLYSTCGATSEGGSNVASSDYLECVDGCECGRVAAGYYSTGGGTSARPTAAGNGCLSGESCGTMAAGYYSRGGAGSANASGYYCWGYNEYSDGVNGCGQVGAGYWNNGGGTDVNGTCVSGKSCGLISAGYYGNAGATTSTGAGEVNGGFFSTGGGKTATPASNSDCAGDGTTCGKIAAGYWSYRGGKTATPTSSADCTMGYCGVIRGGYYSTCGGIEEYATEGSVNSCADGCECGPINPGYYSTGCSISDDGAVCDTSKYTVGEIAAGYYSDGGSNTPQGDGLLAAGYFSTGGATVRKPTSADCVGSNTCGTVNAGYYVSGGGTLAAPVAFGNGCVGQWKNNAGEMVNHACGKVGAGYWNNGGGTDVNGTCVSGKSCGLIDAGYYGNAGATSSTGAGTVWPGHFSTGGATKQKPTAADCVGDNTCGLVAAGYWTSHGGKTATPTTAETDCVNKACGKIAAGYFSTGGATRSNPTEVGNHCFGTSCGLLGAGYYSSGGGTSATPTAVGDGCLTGFVCGGCPTGYDDNTAQGKTAVDQCKISCAAGTRVAARNAACTSPAGGWFSAATLTSYGNVSPVSYCMDGYTSTSTSASGHDAATDCVQTIDGGKYVPSSTINARYVKLTGNLKNSVNNYGVHVVEMQAFASNDGTGTNLMADSTSDKTTDDEWTTSSHVSISTAKTWDLGSVQSLGSLKFALYPGRTYYNVAIYVSEDNTNWTTVFGPQDVLTQSISPLVGEVVVLSAAPKSCAVGTYKASGSLALTNTSSCSMAQAGYFVGTTGASSQTKCVIGSYTDTTGQSACKACAGGKTTSAAGATSCAATCSNATGVASTGWETPVWGTDNKMTNLCTIKATAGCSANYYKNSNACSTCASGTNSKYTLSAAGTTTVNNCYLNTTAKNFVKTAGAGQTTCEKGNYCPGSVKVYYGGTASDTHPTTGGSTQCPANSYCVAGVSAATACSTLGGGLYKNSTAGASAAEDCNFTTTAGKYMVANTDTAQTTCPGKQYCEAETLNWPNVSVLNNGGWNDCPDAATHKRTSFPADYYSPTMTSTTLVNLTGQGSKSRCRVISQLSSATHGDLYEYATWNSENNTYDLTTSYGWQAVKPGYYLTTPVMCGAYAYYHDVKECEENSYCPGKERVVCNSTNEATVHTETFGLNSCSADTDGNYELSSGGVAANSINACYLKTNVGDWVATANAAQTDCQANGYCVGNATVYYGSTGGRTACVAPYGLAAAGSDDANDCYLKTTAGQYVQTAGAGQTTCPAGYWCVGNVAIYKGGSVTGRSTTGGSEQCPAGYRDGTTGYSLQSQCTMNVAGGKYVAAANESSASGTCALGTYKPAHTVTYGKTSSCSACTGATYADQEGMSACEACPTATEYADKVVAYYSNRKSRSGCYARFKEEVANGETTYFNCYLRSGDDYGTLTSGRNCWTYSKNTKCDAGYYSPVVPTPDYDEMWYMNYSTVVNNLCMPVESGYWSGADSLTRTACETGLVTCGAGLCANEAGDCGRKLHAGDNVIYLRSEKRTGVSPLLHVKMKMEDASGEEVDRLFYGNMSTTLSGPLKVKYNNTKYSVVNDNQ